MKVYLAGCFDRKYPREGKRPWRAVVQENFAVGHGIVWLDPETKKLPDAEAPEQFFAWDLAAVRQADVVFAFLSEETPHAHGLAVELGYALALQKPIILVADPAALEKREYRFMVRATDVTYTDLEDGIVYLHSLLGTRF